MSYLQIFIINAVSTFLSVMVCRWFMTRKENK